MKQIIIFRLLVISCFFFSCTQGEKKGTSAPPKTAEQVKRDSFVFSKVIDSFNYKLAVYAIESLTEDSSAKKAELFKKNFSENSSMHRLIAISLNGETQTKNISISNSIEKLKPLYIKTIDPEDLINSLFDTSKASNTNPDFFSLYTERRAKKKDIRNDFILPAITSLRNYYNNLKDTGSSISGVKSTNTLGRKDNNQKKGVENPSENSLMSISLILALIGGIIGGFFIGRFKYRKNSNKPRVENSDTVKRDYSEVDIHSDEFLEYKRKTNRSNLEEKGQSADENKMVLRENINEIIHVQPSPQIVANNEEAISTGRLFYFPPPGSNIYFNNTQASSILRSTDVYVIDIQISGNTATFSIIEDPVITKRALDSPDTYLLSVSELSGLPFTKATGIEIIEKGVVKKDADKWIVTQPAKIKLI
jgi:hypothetical protein